jgi:hypothetical protein
LPSFRRCLLLLSGAQVFRQTAGRESSLNAAGGGGDATVGVHALDECRVDELVAVGSGRGGFGGQQQPRDRWFGVGCVHPVHARSQLSFGYGKVCGGRMKGAFGLAPRPKTVAVDYTANYAFWAKN